MSKSPYAESLFNQVFARIPPETASTFTPEQIEALKQGFSKLTWKQHTNVYLNTFIYNIKTIS